MEYGKCATQTTNKIITAKEYGRKLTINNPAGKIVKKVQVDRCLFINPDEGIRCDYLFEINNPISKVIYLELKGHKIEEAYNQLVATIDRFIDSHNLVIKECHIVASRVPKAGPKVQQLKIKLLKDKKATLLVNTDQAFVTI